MASLLASLASLSEGAAHTALHLSLPRHSRCAEDVGLAIACKQRFGAHTALHLIKLPSTWEEATVSHSHGVPGVTSGLGWVVHALLCAPSDKSRNRYLSASTSELCQKRTASELTATDAAKYPVFFRLTSSTFAIGTRNWTAEREGSHYQSLFSRLS